MELQDLIDIGFNFEAQGAIGFKPDNLSLKSELMAIDSALISTPNIGVPVEITAFIDPRVIEIMTDPRRARELTGEVKKGEWTTPYSKFRLSEMVGQTQPYSDSSSAGSADVNNNWAVREQYLFQTVISYGDFESATSAVAKVNLAADKQRAAANVLDMDYNKFALLGVKGKEIYGLLNDPNLPNAIVAPTTGKGNSSKWNDKETAAIYGDILALFGELSAQSGGLITFDSTLVLALSNNKNINLGSATNFNVSVKDMIEKNFPNLKIIVVPELASMTAGETVMMFAQEVNGMPTSDIGFSIKVLAHRLVQDLSKLEQKWTSSTYGGIVYMPFAFASMTGV